METLHSCPHLQHRISFKLLSLLFKAHHSSASTCLPQFGSHNSHKPYKMLKDLLLKQDSPSLSSSCIPPVLSSRLFYHNFPFLLLSSTLPQPGSSFPTVQAVCLRVHLHRSTWTAHQHGSLLLHGQPLTALTSWLGRKRHTVWKERVWV